MMAFSKTFDTELRKIAGQCTKDPVAYTMAVAIRHEHHNAIVKAVLAYKPDIKDSVVPQFTNELILNLREHAQDGLEGNPLIDNLAALIATVVDNVTNSLGLRHEHDWRTYLP